MPSALVLYHYFYPDDVISSVLFSDLAASLAARGWSVTAAPGNRGCRDENGSYAPREAWGTVKIRRVWRPAWPQSKSWGRILNALWMVTAWSLMAFRTRKAPDVLILGTDPILSLLAVLPWRWRFPDLVIAHWCHDLHPEAEVADGLLRPDSIPLRFLQWMLGYAYARCTIVADLGTCMRRRLEQHYRMPARTVTLTPWALEEPATALAVDPKERRALFGNAKLVLLYSGNFGRAHSYGEILSLARQLRDAPVVFAFSVRGNYAQELREAVTSEDTNVRFIPFASANGLRTRLGAADVHMVSLRPSWTGTVVPSKFFGAIAVGRPVLFAGDPESSVAQWVKQYGLGWVLTPENISSVASELRGMQLNPHWQTEMFERCHQIYQKHFSKEVVITQWQTELHSGRSK